MLAVFLVVAPLATAALVASSFRLESFVASALCAYVVFVTEVTALTAALSPVREVTRTGLSCGAAVALAAAAIVWLRLGRPRPPLAHVPGAARLALSDPVVAAFALVAFAVLAYELLLVATVPANNWDSLTYHLARVEFWVQHHGIYWIPNATTTAINGNQPGAEQQILYLFVALGRGTLFALPQYVAQLVVAASAYVTARRLGFDLRSSACAGLVFVTFALTALESTTAQNDLVAAAFPAAAAALLLGSRRIELVPAGIAVALGVGVKATTLLVLPILLMLALRRGRRGALLFCGWATGSFALVAMWSFVVNLHRTGQVFGSNVAGLTHTSFTIGGTVSIAAAVLYRLPDLPSFGNLLAWEFLGVGANLAIAAAVVGALRRRSGNIRRALAIGVSLALPALTIAFDGAYHHLVQLVDLPIGRGSAFLIDDATGAIVPFSWLVNRASQEDIAGFGPVGGLLLIAVSVWTVVQWARRRAGIERLALGLALPLFLLLLGASTAAYNAYLARFVLVPAALTVPLAAAVFRHAAAAVGILAVSAVSVALVLVHDIQKPFNSPYGHPWSLAQNNAVRLTWEPSVGDAGWALDGEIPQNIRLAAVLGGDQPSYLLFGSSHSRPVEFLPQDPRAAVRQAVADRDWFVVIGGVSPGVARTFSAAGWVVSDLVDPTWQLASDCNVRYVSEKSNVFHCPGRVRA